MSPEEGVKQCARELIETATSLSDLLLGIAVGTDYIFTYIVEHQGNIPADKASILKVLATMLEALRKHGLVLPWPEAKAAIIESLL